MIKTGRVINSGAANELKTVVAGGTKDITLVVRGQRGVAKINIRPGQIYSTPANG